MITRLILVILGVFAITTGCDKDISVDNLLGRVTSIGPVYEQADGRYTVHFSVYDTNGDPTDVTAQYRLTDNQAWQTIPACTTDNTDSCQIIGGLKALGTNPDHAVQHQVAWDAPDSVRNRVIQLRMFASSAPQRGVISKRFLP